MPINTFIAEGNVEIYLCKLHQTWHPERRDTLLRLLVDEENRMGASREHVENGERRVVEGRRRIRMQREFLLQLAATERSTHLEAAFLETLERTQVLLEAHLAALRREFERHRL